MTGGPHERTTLFKNPSAIAIEQSWLWTGPVFSGASSRDQLTRVLPHAAFFDSWSLCLPGLVTSLLLVLFVFVVVHYMPPTSSAISSLFSVFSVCKPVFFLAVVLFTFLSYLSSHILSFTDLVTETSLEVFISIPS